jgi:NAD(P)-dependent dehydrogenase (short-subunit alcohol dehydrogenase family)
VLVTGGTSGIGKATALAFAEAGAKVVITGRREKEGANVVAEVTKNGGTAAFVRADVAKDADVVKAIDFVVSTHGRLDVAFNNAGVEISGPLNEVTEEQYRRTFDINVWGVLNSMKHEIAAMLKTEGGAIVNTSSVAGHIALPQASIYVATKHAVGLAPAKKSRLPSFTLLLTQRNLPPARRCWSTEDGPPLNRVITNGEKDRPCLRF